MTGRYFSDLSSRLAPRIGKFRDTYLFISPSYSFIFSSYFFSIWAQKEGMRGYKFQGGFENVLFTSRVELGIFLSPTEAYD